MRIRLRVFGKTVLSLLFDPTPETAVEYEADDPQQISGGSTHNFERSIESEWCEPYEDDRKFGFNDPG
jgi:hypothetical protein